MWAQPVDQGVVVNNLDVGGLPAEGLAVRVSASSDAQVLAHVFQDERLDVTGPKVWSGDTPFFPVNYGDGGGFVNAFYLTLDSEAPTEIPTDVVTEAPTEIVTGVPTEGVTEVITEVPAEVPTQIVTEVPSEIITEVPTEVVTEAPTEAVTETPTEIVTDVPTEVVTQASQASQASTDVVPEVPAEVASSDLPGTPVVILTAIVTETPIPDAPETPVTGNSETQVVNEVDSGTPITTDDPIAPGSPITTGSSTEEPVGSPVAATPTPTSEASPSTTITPAAAAPDDASAIGSATVTGTNGEGIRCRVAPDSSASTIVVLAEGTVVKVFANSGDGWMQIGCGGQLGYGNINYLWSGGASDADINAGGLLAVSGTGGGLNCRTGAGTTFPVITTIADGTAVSVRGQSSNGWTPVTCAGQSGFVSSAYLSVSPVTNGGGGSSSSGSGTISGTGGDGVRCRTGASTSSSTILVVGEGTQVTIRGAASNGWTPVTCGGQDGYISSQFITGSTSTSTKTPTATKTPAPGSGNGPTTGFVTVSGSGGGVNCRSGAGLSFGVIAVVADGASVATRSGSTNGWQAVSCGNQNGFILQELTSPSSGGGGSSSTPTPVPGGGSGATGTATVTGTGGDGVRCRVSVPSGNVITLLPEGSTVTLRGSANGGWQPVICGGQNGFVSSQYLTLGGGGTAPTATAIPGGGTNPSGNLVSGDHAKVLSELNLRYSPSLGSGVSMVVPAGIVVEITGAVDSNFYPANYDGLKGYLSADYLAKTSDALSKRGGSGNSGTTPIPAPGSNGGSSATGNAMVDFAMGYLGYPYVWATHGPSSFDCSGFTYWVAMNVMGIDIGTGTWTQSVAGSPVSRSSLQPGDLVFFQNTYAAGLSHVGIYIGNDQFIHAENEDTGVRISDLNSQYYSSRWYGAVRLG